MTVTNPGSSSSAGAAAGLLYAPTSTADYREVQSAPERVSLVSDPLGQLSEKVLKVDCSNADVFPITATENPRAQLLSPPLFYPGAELWVHQKVMFPASLPEIKNGFFFQFMQLYGPPAESTAPLQLQLNKLEGVECIIWQRNPTYGFDIPWMSLTTPLQRSHWYDFYIRMGFGPTEGVGLGTVELYWDGNQIEFFKAGTSEGAHAATKRLKMGLLDFTINELASVYYFGNYRKHNTPGMEGTVSLYFTQPKIGLTKTAVT